MQKKTQIVIIHGGETFKNQNDFLRFLSTRTVSLRSRPSWSGDWLDKKLGKKYDIFRPKMPLKENAKYLHWKIHFDKLIPEFKDRVILIGNSLGGIFLAKYLSENVLTKKIQGVILVCPPFDSSGMTDDLVGGFKLKANLTGLDLSSKNLYLLFSKDDPVVPVLHAEKYRRKLPNAKITIFPSKNGHFFISEFPEIVKIISSLKS